MGSTPSSQLPALPTHPSPMRPRATSLQINITWVCACARIGGWVQEPPPHAHTDETQHPTQKHPTLLTSPAGSCHGWPQTGPRPAPSCLRATGFRRPACPSRTRSETAGRGSTCLPGGGAVVAKRSHKSWGNHTPPRKTDVGEWIRLAFITPVVTSQNPTHFALCRVELAMEVPSSSYSAAKSRFSSRENRSRNSDRMSQPSPLDEGTRERISKTKCVGCSLLPCKPKAKGNQKLLPCPPPPPLPTYLPCTHLTGRCPSCLLPPYACNVTCTPQA
jgi:hypothetical protein